MKIVSGNLSFLVDLVKKRIDKRMEEMELSLKKETEQRVARAKSQGKQIRKKILDEAKKDAQRIHNEKMLSAKQESKQIVIQAKGKIEKDLRNQLKDELIQFVQGKKKIGNISYEQLVKKAIENAKKKKIDFDVKKTEQGVVLKTENIELDLRVDSMMETLRVLPVEEVLKNK